MSKRKVSANLKRQAASNSKSLMRRRSRKVPTRAKAERMVASLTTVEAIVSFVSQHTNQSGESALNGHVQKKAYYKCLLLGSPYSVLKNMPIAASNKRASAVSVRKPRRAPSPKNAPQNGVCADVAPKAPKKVRAKKPATVTAE